jgi:N-acetylmuramoyl-L-alanine amidase
VKDKLRYVWGILFILLVNLLVIAIVNNWSGQAIQTLSKVGSRGNEVTQIQTKLKDQGLFTGKVDGIFGAATKASLIKFQQKKGLTADGVA